MAKHVIKMYNTNLLAKAHITKDQRCIFLIIYSKSWEGKKHRKALSKAVVYKKCSAYKKMTFKGAISPSPQPIFRAGSLIDGTREEIFILHSNYNRLCVMVQAGLTCSRYALSQLLAGLQGTL